ncbi:unnamed protein product [Adineta steineri]|uniref:Uncharacterized protein n=1 Tax=Adineta steineri TaxID=433720 RepID=A0A819X0Q1_9BILA|nr:unnamed protein product [Adineta steineri]
MGDVGTIQLPSHNQQQIVSKRDSYWVPVAHNRFTRMKTLIGICAVIGAVIFVAALLQLQRQQPQLLRHRRPQPPLQQQHPQLRLQQQHPRHQQHPQHQRQLQHQPLQRRPPQPQLQHPQPRLRRPQPRLQQQPHLLQLRRLQLRLQQPHPQHQHQQQHQLLQHRQQQPLPLQRPQPQLQQQHQPLQPQRRLHQPLRLQRPHPRHRHQQQRLQHQQHPHPRPQPLRHRHPQPRLQQQHPQHQHQQQLRLQQRQQHPQPRRQQQHQQQLRLRQRQRHPHPRPQQLRHQQPQQLQPVTTVSCPTGYSATQTAKCVDILSSLYNCGSVGFVCSSKYKICSAGVCKTTPTIQLSGATAIPAWVGTTTDDDIQQVSLPVNVTLYNYSTSLVTVSSNGLLCLGYCTIAYANENLPTGLVGGPTAFVFWYDLAIYAGTGQMVYYSTSGTAPNRITGFEFYTSSSSYPSNYYHFLILFYENLPNIVEYVYLEISDGGSLATIGVQQSSAGPSITYSVDQAFAVAYNTTLQFDTNAGTYIRLG